MLWIGPTEGSSGQKSQFLNIKMSSVMKYEKCKILIFIFFYQLVVNRMGLHKLRVMFIFLIKTWSCYSHS